MDRHPFGCRKACLRKAGTTNLGSSMRAGGCKASRVGVLQNEPLLGVSSEPVVRFLTLHGGRVPARGDN
jgi:hypothetical protein